MLLYTLPKELHPDFAVPGKKPIGPVEVDWSNPITRDLALCQILGPNQFYDLSKQYGKKMAVTGSGQLRKNGVYVNWNSSQGLEFPDNEGVDLPANTDCTFVLDYEFISMATALNPGIFRVNNVSSGNEFFILQGATGYPWLRWGGTDVIKASSGQSFAETGTIGFALSDANNCAFYKDGIKTHEASHAKSNAASQIVHLGYQNLTTEYLEGVFKIVLVWLRELNPAEMRAITENPYQILKPAIPMTYFTPAAAATTQFPIILPKQLHPDFAVPGRKPVGPVEIDRSNFFGKRLRHAYLMRDVGSRDLAGQKNGTLVGTSITPKAGNLDFNGDAGTDRINLGSITASDFLSLQQDTTILCRAYVDTANATNAFPRIYDKSDGGSAANGHALWITTSTGVFTFGVDREGAAGAEGVDSGAIADGWRNIACGTNHGSEIFIYVEGDSLATTALVTTIEDATTNMAIGNWNHSTDREWKNQIEYLFFFDGYFDQATINRFWADPYQILKPAIPMTYFTAAAAGGGAYPMPLHHHYQVNIGSQ